MEEKSQLDKIFEDYSVDSVPDEKTKNWLSMGLIWAGVGISLGLLLTGGTIGNGLTIKQTIMAAFIGGFILALVTILIGVIGARTRLSTAMISRFTFGERAIVIIAIIQALGSYGWFAVQLGLFGRTAATAWEMGTGLGGNEKFMIVFGGLCMMLTATIGYKALDFLSKVAVPLLIILMGASVWVILQDFSFSEILSFKGTGDPISIGLGISMVISSFVVGAVVAPDVSRYAKTSKDTVGAAILAFAVVVPMVMLVGSTMAQATGSWDIVDIMLRLGWGVIAFIVLMLAQWTSNDNNLYCGALGFTVAFKKLKKWHITVISGVIGILLALLGIYDNFISFLSVIGILIPPMGGVIAVDYYLFKKKQYDTSNLSNLVNIRYLAFASWIIGSAVSLLTTYTSLTITTVSAFDGLVFAAVAHFIFMKYIKEESLLKVTSDSLVNDEIGKPM
jgi:cytosine permease